MAAPLGDQRAGSRAAAMVVVWDALWAGRWACLLVGDLVGQKAALLAVPSAFRSAGK